MKFCVNCGTQLEDAAVFCTNCGAKQEAPVAAPVAAPVDPVYQPAPVVAPVEPVYQPAPTYQAPVQQGPSAGSKVLGGIGFGLAMTGFLMAFISFIASLTTIDMGYYSAVETASTVIGIVVACLAFSIIGLIFCGKARKAGVGGLATTGKVFGIISLPLFGLAFLISIITMI